MSLLLRKRRKKHQIARIPLRICRVLWGEKPSEKSVKVREIICPILSSIYHSRVQLEGRDYSAIKGTKQHWPTSTHFTMDCIGLDSCDWFRCELSSPGGFQRIGHTARTCSAPYCVPRQCGCWRTSLWEERIIVRRIPKSQKSTFLSVVKGSSISYLQSPDDKGIVLWYWQTDETRSPWFFLHTALDPEIGRASCRERV